MTLKSRLIEKQLKVLNITEYEKTLIMIPQLLAGRTRKLDKTPSRRQQRLQQLWNVPLRAHENDNIRQYNMIVGTKHTTHYTVHLTYYLLTDCLHSTYERLETAPLICTIIINIISITLSRQLPYDIIQFCKR